MQTVNSKINLSSASDIIAALQNTASAEVFHSANNNNHSELLQLRSQVIMPDLETPYSQAKFSTTDYPSIEHNQSISAIITERQQQLDAVLRDMSGLETFMVDINNLHQHLFYHKDKIIRSMNLHKSFASALWRLPTEILSQIFHHCLPEFHDWPCPSKLQAPLLLTQICRRWREVAVGTPSLWCQLHVGAECRDWQGQAFCYDSWLKNSRGRPLSLMFLYYANDYSIKLRQLLQPYINHITYLFIDVLSVNDTPKLMLSDFVTLEELIIDAPTSEYAVAPIVHNISQLPLTLRSLCVQGPTFHLNILSFFSLVSAHLTDIVINLYEPNAVLYLLQLAPNLFSLKTVVYSRHREALEPFMHSKLRSLHITQRGFADREPQLSYLLDALSLPNLRVLDVEIRGVHSWPHEAFKAFLTRSNCPLESLIAVSGAMTKDEQRAEYFALVPSLQSLVLGPSR